MDKNLPEVLRLDLMIAYSCNLSCRGCISISDVKRDGIAPYEDIVEWIEYWSKIVTPKVLALFGGEPCLHPRLFDICEQVRKHWPDTTIRLITNGYLMDRFDSSRWFDFAPFEIQFSVHRSDHRHIIDQAIKNILQHKSGWRIERNKDWHIDRQYIWTLNNFRIFKSIFKDFIVPYKEGIEPWYSDPKEAHSICGSPATPVIYKGKMYKCPAVANAMDLTGKNWFGYTPCIDSTTIIEHVANIGRPETVCGQCPNRTQAVVIDHFDKNNVTVKQHIS